MGDPHSWQADRHGGRQPPFLGPGAAGGFHETRVPVRELGERKAAQNVRHHLGQKLDGFPTFRRFLEPDVVVLATGASPATIPVPGLDEALTGNDVLNQSVDTGRSVLIVGGGMVGIEVAEFLAEQGKIVTVVEMLSEIARDMEPITRKLTLKRLQQFPVEMLTDTVLETVDGGQAKVRGPDGERDLGPFDSVVVAVGTRSNNELAEPLLARGMEVHVVGDAAELDQIIGAVRSAWEVACSI